MTLLYYVVGKYFQLEQHLLYNSFIEVSTIIFNVCGGGGGEKIIVRYLVVENENTYKCPNIYIHLLNNYFICIPI